MHSQFRFAPLPHTHAPLAPGFPLTVSPYLYFHREAASYTALATGCADAEIVPMPRLRALLRLSSEHEKLLMDSRRLKGFIPNVFRQYFRAVPEEMPLVAVLMEYIPGRRLTRMDVRSEERRREAEEALAWIHDHGVVHADINWRNILLMRDGTESEGNDCEDSGGDGQEARCEETHEDWVYERGRIVFVDFSNAIPKAFVDSDDAWIDKVGIERARLKRLLDVGRPRGSR